MDKNGSGAANPDYAPHSRGWGSHVLLWDYGPVLYKVLELGQVLTGTLTCAFHTRGGHSKSHMCLGGKYGIASGLVHPQFTVLLGPG